MPVYEPSCPRMDPLAPAACPCRAMAERARIRYNSQNESQTEPRLVEEFLKVCKSCMDCALRWR